MIDVTGLNEIPNPDYIGVIKLTGSNSSETINNFATTPSFPIRITFTDDNGLASVIFTAGDFRFPTPSTDCILSTPELDFVEFRYNSLANKLIQTASEQY